MMIVSGLVGFLVLSAVLIVFVAFLYRVVVPTNEVHTVQKSTKTISYGKDTANGN